MYYRLVRVPPWVGFQHFYLYVSSFCVACPGRKNTLGSPFQLLLSVKKKRVTFGYMMKSWKFDWWNSVDFTLNLNPCILTYTWFIHKGKSEMSLNVLQFEFEPLFCDEYTWAQVKCHWRIWDMKGYIKSYLNQFDKIFSSFLQLYINWHLEVGCRFYTFRSVTGSGPTEKCHRREFREDIMIQLPVSVS